MADDVWGDHMHFHRLRSISPSEFNQYAFREIPALRCTSQRRWIAHANGFMFIDHFNASDILRFCFELLSEEWRNAIADQINDFALERFALSPSFRVGDFAIKGIEFRRKRLVVNGDVDIF